MNLKACISILVPMAIIGIAPAQTDAKTVLKQAVQACKDVKTAELSVEGTYASTKVKATIWQARDAVPDSGFLPGKYRIKGTADEGGSLSFFEMAYDGKALRIKDNNDDVTVVDHPSPYQAGQNTPMPAMLASFSLLGGRFDDFLNGKAQLRPLPAIKVRDWTCDVVEIKWTAKNPVVGDVELTVRWAFDQKTHLPVQHSSDTGTVTVTQFKLNPTIDDKVFRLEAKSVKMADPLGPATAHLLPIGSAAPKFTLKSPKGKTLNLAAFRGKVLVLDFWGTWCLPCRKTMPILEKLNKQYGGKGVAILGISVDRDYDPVAFMKRMGYTYPIAVKGESASKAYHAQVLPTLYVIGPDGRIRYRQAGINRDDETRLPKIIAGARSSPRH
jgi:thiol-disulfide isomerase/thioredoxin